MQLVDPLNGEKFIEVPETNVMMFHSKVNRQEEEEINEIIQSVKECPKSGLHNPFKNPERYILFFHVLMTRYVLYGELSRKIANLMYDVNKTLFSSINTRKMLLSSSLSLFRE